MAGDAPDKIGAVQINSTGRMIAISLPRDTTDAELLEFVGWSGSQLAPKLRELAKPGAGRIIIPGH
jgi:hypothetical protein